MSNISVIPDPDGKAVLVLGTIRTEKEAERLSKTIAQRLATTGSPVGRTPRVDTKPRVVAGELSSGDKVTVGYSRKEWSVESIVKEGKAVRVRLQDEDKRRRTVDLERIHKAA